MTLVELLTVLFVFGFGYLGGREGFQLYSYIGGIVGAVAGMMIATVIYHLFRRSIGVKK